MLGEIFRYIDEHFEEHVEKIREFIMQPTVSPTDEGIEEGAEMMLGYIKEVTDEAELIYPVPDGNPIVYGHLKSKDPKAKTLIFHSMYDVMPITRPELWVASPFEAQIIEGKRLGLPSKYKKVIVGRGARNQKGPTLAHLNAILSILKVNDDVPLRARIFIIEGEEERGSFPSLRPFVKEHINDLKKANAVYYPRMDEDGEGNLVIKLGRRGTFHYFLEVQGGEWGGPAEKDLFDVSNCMG
jgi:acetylornithine deacetylase/succinyl-diaminopimelate desuccinylase-like protein